MTDPRATVTSLLEKLSDGDPNAMDRLVPLLYDDLRGIARGRLRREATDPTLAASDLVHETFLRLIRLDGIEWQDRSHFLAIAAHVMSQVLIDRARRANAAKRGGNRKKVALDAARLATDARIERSVQLDEALERLADEKPRAAGVLEQRCFDGYTNEEIAEAMDISVSTVERDLRFARSLLAEEFESAG
ncbi:MAG: sigma-70 family RNA polymerase sigma factor [Gemmatimonadetes bacterium]|uniref:Sigma-70 family RNA polymerase sigma factor n=1 Tax=Candidatus Kutchimonas denitrificans TaxID=3056748 RepID=A0AAE4Z4H3_9BACT|nr:sigma-70 family RNA polymerase sigma factor [Gemmatimonadota bacterium]NIR73595.1 sigma-70 family RNA polymerase sigma factor [Candidatus Kutchimonas denitrificans]NIR99554.1 sigma-70 family RNA polymerase sigma factor [Gemmatimonadota bacterium]NIT65174.1 sigma-70 family RNA polymerase sigma factor [Gemmatimonadota bacterium]NIW75579.1 sigma-70 family RNA polymerase sigma factor [Gemmatimonadota bacterium]